MATSTSLDTRPRVVVVDDEPSIRNAIAQLLADCGIDVVGTAEDGQAGAEVVADLRPHVVVMDLRMPRLNGADATRIMRSHDESVQVVLLSAYDDPALMSGAKEAGAYAYLVKGCPGGLVVDVVMQAYALASGLRGREREEAAVAPIRIVVADDVAAVRDGLSDLLNCAGKGMSVVGTAADGHEAVRVAIELVPDVLIVDLRMPGLDGITVALHVATLAPDVAVVLHSGYTDTDLIADATRAGASGFIAKGSSLDTIASVLRQVVTAKQTQRADDPGISVTSSPDSSGAPLV